MPVMGMESEFNVWLDEVEINPETYWKHPKAFIDAPMLEREKTSSQIPRSRHEGQPLGEGLLQR